MSFPILNPAANVTGGGGGSSLNPVTTPFIDTLNVPLANTEVPYTLPTNTKRFKIQNRDNGLIRLSYISGFTTDFWSIFPGDVFEEDWINLVSLTIYVESNKPLQTLEILSWS